MHDTDLGPGRPDADECLPYYFTYIDLVPDGHVLELLERQITESAAFLAGFTPAQTLWREAPGEWNIVEIVGHLVDTERVFEYRALRIARADPVMWTSGRVPRLRGGRQLPGAPARRRRGRIHGGPRRLRRVPAWPGRGRLGSAERRRTGPSAACAPSPTPWPATSSITWRPSAGSTAASVTGMEDVYCFGGNPLDRASERRDDGDWIAKLLDDPDTRLLPLRDLKPFTRGTTVPALDWQPVAPWREQIDAGAPLIFLGLGDGRAHFAIDAAGANVAPDVDTELIDVRALAPTIAAGEAAILAEARSLLDWHARHRFCAQCGSPTRMASAGWKRRCPACRASHFPRTDPVVIMLAIRGERALLGRNRRRPGARFSCLAGFVEPGETPEEAVRREVREEAGVRCGRVRYLAAQPWPFPSSLMMGFLTEALTEEITVDPEEIAEARWFSRDEIREMVARAATGPDDPTKVSLPAPIAIAHHICRRWSSGLDSVVTRRTRAGRARLEFWNSHAQSARGRERSHGDRRRRSRS